MHQLVPLELGRLDEGLATLGANMYPWTVCMQVFSHGRVIAKHFGASLVRASNSSDRIFTPSFFLRLHSVKKQSVVIEN